MKYILFLGFFIGNLLIGGKIEHARVVASDIESTTIDFSIDDFQLVPVSTDKGSMYAVHLENGASLLEKGAPDIHKITRSIIIPDDANMKVEIISSEYTDYENIEVAPSKGNFSRLVNPANVARDFGPVYSQDTFYPGSLAELQNPYILRNLRGQAIDFHPIQYNPIRNILRVYHKIEIKVYAEGESITNVLHRSSTVQNLASEFSHIYENHFLNYKNDTRFEYLEDKGNFLIISHGSFMQAMQPLVDWKNRKGIPTEIVNVSDIGSNATTIKNYVADYYEEHGLTFLLLVGDASQIPSTYISGSASDPNFGFIEGNDSYAEVIVGRFSAESPNHVATQVERAINYERYPEAGADWYSSALGVASNQGPGFGGYTDDDFNELVLKPLLLDFTYDAYQGIYDGSGGTLSQGITAINNGVSIINYTGHGYQQGWSNGAPLSNSDVDNLTNTNMLPFVITVGCNVGEFDDYLSFGEVWQRATHNGEPTGGIAHMGSTISQSWEPPMHGQYGMNLILTESYENHITRTLGGISTNGCMYMNDAQGSSGINETNYWTYFGDPTTEVRTAAPTALNISHDAAIVLGQSEFAINTGASGATVALSQNNELLAFTYADVNGNAELELDDLDLVPGDYDLVVTAFNAFPHEATLSVIAPEGPYVTMDSYTLTDNENGNADFGETVTLTIHANNVGVDNATNVSGTVSIDDDYISMNSGSLNFGTIQANGSASSAGVSFDISHLTPDAHNAVFMVNFSSNEGEWEANFSVPIHAPLFTVSDPSYIDNGQDGVWDPGEEINLLLNLNNEGSAGHYYYPGVYLTTNSPHATIDPDNEYFWFYGIMEGQSAQTNFPVIASASANTGTEVEFTAWGLEMACIQYSTPCIQGEPFTFSITIGLPVNEDLHEPLNLTATPSEAGIDLAWDEPFTCPEGQFADCIGQCIDQWYEAWIGDGLCDDGTWDVYFNCEEFNNDGGDCGDVLTCEDQGLVTCPNGECEESLDDCPDTSCEAGYVDDCSGDGDCCPESWIGDGYADCEDQAYGCDLSCFDNDGGDCGSRDYFSDTGKTEKMYPSRINYDFSNAVIIPKGDREVEGYFIFKDGAYIAYANEMQYSDGEVLGGNEYCYHITAVYDEGQSGPSNTACAVAEGLGCLTGDLNCDDTINILDVVTMVNMVLGQIEPNLDTADLNGDGIINILDVITLVNLVLGSRSVDVGEAIGTKASLITSMQAASITADGNIAGFQLTVNADDLQVNKNLPLTVKSALVNDQYVIIGYGVSGEVLDGKNQTEIFSAAGGYEITSAIIANETSQSMEVNIAEAVLPETFELNQNFPNPFNPSTDISFSIGSDDFINLNIYDIQGRLIRSLIDNGFTPAGTYSFTWNGLNQYGTHVPSGMYLYKLESSEQTITRKMVMMK